MAATAIIRRDAVRPGDRAKSLLAEPLSVGGLRSVGRSRGPASTLCVYYRSGRFRFSFSRCCEFVARAARFDIRRRLVRTEADRKRSRLHGRRTDVPGIGLRLYVCVFVCGLIGERCGCRRVNTVIRFDNVGLIVAATTYVA